MIVENIGGAGGTIGMARVTKAAPDGYTIAVWHVAQATAPALYDNLRYHVINDFDQLGRITDVPMTLVVEEGPAGQERRRLIAWMKQTADKVTYGHAGIGSASHLCALKLDKELGIKMTGVAYRGTGPAMNDLLGGQFDIMCDQTTNTTNQIKDGKIKGYAVTIKQKVSLAAGPADARSVRPPGLRGLRLARRLRAEGTAERRRPTNWSRALQAALKDPKVVERFASLGTDPVAQDQATPAALKAQLQAEVAKWGPVIKAAGAKGE